MAVKLINRTSHGQFVAFIRTASELDAWNALWEASSFMWHARVSKARRAAIKRTIDQAEAAYVQTFGRDWAPF